jgi:hypothetical protein
MIDIFRGSFMAAIIFSLSIAHSVTNTIANVTIVEQFTHPSVRIVSYISVAKSFLPLVTDYSVVACRELHKLMTVKDFRLALGPRTNRRHRCKC